MLESTYYLLPRIKSLNFKISKGDRERQLSKIGYDPILDITKNKISSVPHTRWSRLRKLLNTMEFPFDSKKIQKPISRAYFKLLELVVDLDININGNTLHLAEAPGGFIEATRYIKTKKSLSSSDIYYTFSIIGELEVPIYNKTLIKDSRIIVLSNKINRGDLYNIENIKYLVKLLESDGINFITCDGGFTENNDFASKEQLHHKLIFNEMITSLFILSSNGSLVLKIFDIFTELTFDYVYLLSYLFEKVYICKPITSRPTNSEKYIVCKGFIKKDFTNDIKKHLIFLCNSGIENYSSIIEKKTVQQDFVNNIFNINNTIEISNFYPDSKKNVDAWIEKYY
jgi:23S rRNA U2552 (ribose-2'-O)-methylase RlmE/FtsJ